jgi:S1-C subfamily serine protease
MGLDGQDMDAATEAVLDVDGGAMIGRVADGSPAAKAGIHANDVVIAVDGKPLLSMGELVVSLRSHRPGDVVTLTVLRGRDRKTMRVTLVERPRDIAA